LQETTSKLALTFHDECTKSEWETNAARCYSVKDIEKLPGIHIIHVKQSIKTNVK